MKIKIGDRVQILEVGKYFKLEGDVFDIVDDECHISTELYKEPKTVITKKVRKLK